MEAVEICSNALVRLGQTPIQSFDEPTDMAILCKNLYAAKSLYVLSCFPWSFAFKYAQLSRLTVAPSMQWKYQFELPPDKTSNNPAAVYFSDLPGALPVTCFEITGSKLLSNSQMVYVKYQGRPDETTWPHYFTELMIMVMATDLCYPVTADAALYNSFRVQTYGTDGSGSQNGLMADTKFLDSSGSQQQQQVYDFPLLAARS